MKAAQERALTEATEYILPLRLDDTDLHGILQTTAYKRLKDSSLEEIAALVVSKVSEKTGGVCHSTDAVFKTPRARQAFEEHCTSLKSLASASKGLKITYSALSGGEHLFFLSPTIDWLAHQRRLTSQGFRIERLVFFDGNQYRTNEAYRWQIRKMFNALSEFTRPLLRFTAIDSTAGGEPSDFQIFTSAARVRLLMIPKIEGPTTISPVVTWRIVQEEEDLALINRAERLFDQYAAFPDHSSILASDNPRSSSALNPIRILNSLTLRVEPPRNDAKS